MGNRAKIAIFLVSITIGATSVVQGQEAPSQPIPRDNGLLVLDHSPQGIQDPQLQDRINSQLGDESSQDGKMVLGTDSTSENGERGPTIPSNAGTLGKLDPEKVRTSIEQALKKRKNFSGTVLIGQGDQSFQGAKNLRSKKTGKTAYTTDSQFLLASVTKQFTAALVLRKIQDDLEKNVSNGMKLDDKVGKYILAAPSSWDNITIAHLLSQTSTLGEYMPNIKSRPPSCYNRRRDRVPGETDPILFDIERFAPCAKPGSKYVYSNSNFYLLGRIVEVATHKSLEELLQEEIIGPLRLDFTGMYSPSMTANRLYAASPHPERVKPYYYAVGSMYSSVGDLFKWTKALLEDHKVISPDFIALMTTPQPNTKHIEKSEHTWVPELISARNQGLGENSSALPDGLEEKTKDGKRIGYYGFGLHLYVENGKRLVYHTGHFKNNSATTLVEQFLDDKITVIVLTRTRNYNVFGVANDIIRSVFDINEPSKRVLVASKTKTSGAVHRKRRAGRATVASALKVPHPGL